MDRLRQLRSQLDSSSFLYYSADVDSDDSLYYSAFEDDIEAISSPSKHHSVNTVQLLLDAVSNENSNEYEMDIDYDGVAIPEKLSNIGESLAASTDENIPSQNDGEAGLNDSNFDNISTDVETYAADVLQQQNLNDRGSERDVVGDGVYDTVAAVVDSTASSCDVVPSSTGAISKTANLTLPDQRKSKVVLTAWNAAARRNKTPRKTFGKFSLIKPTSMYVSSIPAMNKRVTLNVNHLMPSGILGLAKKRKSISKNTPKKKSAMAGPSGLCTSRSSDIKIANICDICHKSFDLKISLMEHRLKHSEKELSSNCKYCDHKFQKAIALETHLKEKCPKIPVSERRKILINEFKKLSQTSQDLF